MKIKPKKALIVGYQLASAFTEKIGKVWDNTLDRIPDKYKINTAHITETLMLGGYSAIGVMESLNSGSGVDYGDVFTGISAIAMVTVDLLYGSRRTLESNPITKALLKDTEEITAETLAKHSFEVISKPEVLERSAYDLLISRHRKLTLEAVEEISSSSKEEHNEYAAKTLAKFNYFYDTSLNHGSYDLHNSFINDQIEFGRRYGGGDLTIDGYLTSRFLFTESGFSEKFSELVGQIKPSDGKEEFIEAIMKKQNLFEQSIQESLTYDISNKAEEQIRISSKIEVYLRNNRSQYATSSNNYRPYNFEEFDKDFLNYQSKFMSDEYIGLFTLFEVADEILEQNKNGTLKDEELYNSAVNLKNLKNIYIKNKPEGHIIDEENKRPYSRYNLIEAILSNSENFLKNLKNVEKHYHKKVFNKAKIVLENDIKNENTPLGLIMSIAKPQFEEAIRETVENIYDLKRDISKLSEKDLKVYEKASNMSGHRLLLHQTLHPRQFPDHGKAVLYMGMAAGLFGSGVTNLEPFKVLRGTMLGYAGAIWKFTSPVRNPKATVNNIDYVVREKLQEGKEWVKRTAGIENKTEEPATVKLQKRMVSSGSDGFITGEESTHAITAQGFWEIVSGDIATGSVRLFTAFTGYIGNTLMKLGVSKNTEDFYGNLKEKFYNDIDKANQQSPDDRGK